MPSDLVVTVTATIMSGRVVRWYWPGKTAIGGEIMSASRDGVLVNTFLHNVPDRVLATAREAHRRLAAGQEVYELATHDRKPFSDVLEPVAARHADT